MGILAFAVLQTINLAFLYRFYVAKKFVEYCAVDANIAQAKRLGRDEKRIVALVAAANRSRSAEFWLCCRLAFRCHQLESIVRRTQLN